MSVKKTEVDEKKIIDLYLAGYSQKDIIHKFNISSKNMRQILNQAGIETHNFRALDEDVTNVIIQLITSGVRFKDVERICDISFHATRDVVFRNNLQRASKRARYENGDMSVPDTYVRNAEFLKRYLKGESFCALCKEFSLSDEEIVFEFLSVNDREAARHRKKLKEKVLADAALNFSPTSIARKHKISMAIVKDMLRQQTEK